MGLHSGLRAEVSLVDQMAEDNRVRAPFWENA